MTEGERQSLIRHAGQYAPLLRQHILKEDRILYPMALQRLAADDLSRMATEFETFERDVMGEGKHHALHHLADRLIAATGVAGSSLNHH